MANLVQLKVLEELDGVLLVDKPAGIAFTTVVKAVKRRFNLVKVGHGGSLDAMASGLFVLLINDANRQVGDVMGADRSYTGTMRLGLATNTHDVHGEPVGTPFPVAASAVTPEAVSAALAEFRGDVFQTESRWCSIRREGAADYEVADTGEHKPFLAHVYRFDVGEEREARPDGTVRVPFALSATKGVIPRTLVNDFGAALRCGAALEGLRRVKVGRFSVDDAVAFDAVLATEPVDFPALVKPLSRAFL